MLAGDSWYENESENGLTISPIIRVLCLILEYFVFRVPYFVFGNLCFASPGCEIRVQHQPYDTHHHESTRGSL